MGVVTKRKGKKKRYILVNVTNCSYQVVRDVAESKGWQHYEEDEGIEDDREWTVYWTDKSVSTERVMKLKSYQRLNHFPSMITISRKAGLSKHLTSMYNIFPEEYDFFPRTWVLPQESANFKTQFDLMTGHSKKTYIVKPDAGAQGRGIYLTRDFNKIDMTEKTVAQRYLSKPLLIDGFKFDMRIYVLILSCEPLKIKLFRNGLIRICTSKYTAPTKSNLNNSFMHLTNYSINKNNETFEFNKESCEDGKGSKRSITWFRNWLQSQGHDESKVWDSISDVVIKTMIPVQPLLAHTYRSCVPETDTEETSACFELLGFDIMLDKNLKPWVIEVNHSPSFGVDTPLDYEIKFDVLTAVMHMINVNASDKRKYKVLKTAESKSRLYGDGISQSTAQTKAFNEKLKLRGIKREKTMSEKFDQIYPLPPGVEDKYLKLFIAADVIFEESVGGLTRSYRSSSSVRGSTPGSIRHHSDGKNLGSSLRDAILKSFETPIKPASPLSNSRHGTIATPSTSDYSESLADSGNTTTTTTTTTSNSILSINRKRRPRIRHASDLTRDTTCINSSMVLPTITTSKARGTATVTPSVITPRTYARYSEGKNPSSLMVWKSSPDNYMVSQRTSVSATSATRFVKDLNDLEKGIIPPGLSKHDLLRKTRNNSLDGRRMNVVFQTRDGRRGSVTSNNKCSTTTTTSTTSRSTNNNYTSGNILVRGDHRRFDSSSSYSKTCNNRLSDFQVELIGTGIKTTETNNHDIMGDIYRYSSKINKYTSSSSNSSSTNHRRGSSSSSSRSSSSGNTSSKKAGGGYRLNTNINNRYIASNNDR